MSMLSVPLKTILPYHADLQNETISAEGWEIADGRTLTAGQQDINPGSTYTLPDLRNVFLLGADITKAAANTGDHTINGSGGAPGPKGQSGSNIKTLATAELPAHTHTGTTVSNGSHTHTGTSNTAGAHTHAGSSTNITGNHTHSVSDPGHSHNVTYLATATGAGPGSSGSLASYDSGSTAVAATNVTIQANGDHQHTLSIASDGGHSHTLTVDAGGSHTHTFTTDATGSGTGFDKRPRFYGIVFIMKVKK